MVDEKVALDEVPITSPAMVMKRYSLLNLLMFFLSAIPVVWLITLYFRGAIFPLPAYGLLLLFPLSLMLWWIAWAFCAVFVARLFLSIARLLHKPREGIFNADKTDKDYRYWHLRAAIRKFGIWAVHTFPMPWMDIPAFKILGLKQEGGGTAFFDAFVDPEFLEVGDNTLFGLGSYILTSMVAGGKFILKKTRLGRYTLVGAEAVVGPGANIGDDVVHGSVSTTSVGQEMESGWIFMGQPCRKMKENKMAQTLQYKKTDVVEAGRTEAHTKVYYTKAVEAGTSIKDVHKKEVQAQMIQDGKNSDEEAGEGSRVVVPEVPKEKKQHLNYGLCIGSFIVFFFVSYVIPCIIAYLYYSMYLLPAIFTPEFSFYELIPMVTSFSMSKLIAFTTIPFAFIGLYALHLFLYIWVGRFFVRAAEKKWPVAIGVYERDFAKTGHLLKWYHYRHFIVRILKWRISHCMFPWLINWAWKFLGVAKLGKGVVLEDHFLPPELLQIDDNGYIGSGVVVGTHTVEGVFGRLVIAGAIVGKNCSIMPNALLGPGPHLEDDSHILPRGACAKAYHLRSGGYYWGIPVYKLSKSQTRKLLKGF